MGTGGLQTQPNLSSVDEPEVASNTESCKPVPGRVTQATSSSLFTCIVQVFFFFLNVKYREMVSPCLGS